MNTDFRTRAVERVLRRRDDFSIEWIADLFQMSDILQYKEYPQYKKFEIISDSARDVNYSTM